MLQNDLPGFSNTDNKLVYCRLSDAINGIAHNTYTSPQFSTTDDPYGMAYPRNGDKTGVIIPKDGIYLINSSVIITGGGLQILIYVNNVYKCLAQHYTGSINASLMINSTLRLKKGDLVQVKCLQTTGVVQSFDGSIEDNWMEIIQLA